ncbi:MAG: HD domain-containing protein [Pseudomonadota bacterium]
MIVIVTGSVAAGKTTLLEGLAAGLVAQGDVAVASDREEIHAAVIRDCRAGDARHGEVRRHLPEDVPGVDTRVALFDAYYLVLAADALIERMHAFLRDSEDGVLLVEWATGPCVDFAASASWSGDDRDRWLEQTLGDVLARLQREGLLPRIRLVWVDRPAATRAGINAVRRDAVPEVDFDLLGPAGGGLHELSASGLRLVASLADGGRFAAVQNGESRAQLIARGEELGRGWAPPSPGESDSSDLTNEQRGWVDAAREFVRADQGDDASGHDHHHSERVWRLSRRLAMDTPGADLPVVELAALLHDIDDWKRRPPGTEGEGKTAGWLHAAGVPADLSARIIACIRQVSFESVDQPGPDTVEARLVQDADRLDALGAIGLARLFAFGGARGRRLHDPAEAPVLGMDGEAYKIHEGTSVNHIYEKILHLRDLLNTDAARAIGGARHRVVEDFLAQLLEEWEGRR